MSLIGPNMHNKRINQKCNRIRLVLHCHMSQYEQTRIGRIKRRKRWYWNISDKTILKDPQTDYTGILRTGCLRMKIFLFTTLTLASAFFGCAANYFFPLRFGWLLSVGLPQAQLLKSIYTGTYCCFVVVLRKLKSGQFNQNIR